ncbi:MAG: hypothetical protein WAM81_01415 [Acidimicrobiia bacterium]
MKSYLAVVRGSTMLSMVYRFGFLAAAVGNVIYLGVAYYLWKSVYGDATSIRGLTFDQTFLYVALGSTLFIVLKTYIDWTLFTDIREGIVAIYLVRPIDFQLYMLASCSGFFLLSFATLVAPTILLMVFVFKVSIPLSAPLALLPISLMLAFVLTFCFDYGVGLSGFYTESIWGISTVKDTLVLVLSGALIPLQFFPNAIRDILQWLPFQAVYYTPLSLVTLPDQGWQHLTRFAVQLGWVVVLLTATRLYYRRAVRVLRIAGG